MNKLLLKAYHQLPAAGRSWAVFLHASRLKAWRYGPETDRLVAEAFDRENWSAGQWQVWREERLTRLLHQAATKVPYYREQWQKRRRKGDSSSWAYLENWPVLEKAVLRKSPEAFVIETCDWRNMRPEFTSGTTGTPVKVWWSRAAARAWYALFEARVRCWHGVSNEDRWAILGGQVVTPVRQKRPPFWVWNAPMRQLYLSSYHLSSAHSPHYLTAIRRYGVKYLLGYSSSLHILAREILRSGQRLDKLRVVITNAEPLYDDQRSAMARAFDCPIRETYGMAEIVSAASECEFGRMHAWPEVGVTEILGSNEQHGELACTGLLNPDMPLIRYVVGDSGTAGDSEDRCSCGRTLPPMPKVHGRSNDMLLTRDGRKVFWLNPVFYGLPLEEAQIIQERIDRVRVRYTPSPGFSERCLRDITERLQERLGPVQVQAEALAQIPRDGNGKFRAIVCDVPLNERPD